MSKKRQSIRNEPSPSYPLESATDRTAEEDRVLALAAHILESRIRRDAVNLTSSRLTRQWIKLRLGKYEREVFLVIYLDNQHRLIAAEELFWGTLDGSLVHPREVVKAALRHNAGALIFAHNHPSGVAAPSQADIGITRRLKAALDLVDIRTLDHLIVGDAEVVSMAECGLL